MNTYHIQQQVEMYREQYINSLMPDICQLIPSKGTNITVNPMGITVQTPATAKLWRGVTDIKCRIDVSRAFRPDELDVQTTVVDEYNLQLPFDADVDEDDHVIIAGNAYEIRKLKKASAWDYTIEALIMRVSTEFDT